MGRPERKRNSHMSLTFWKMLRKVFPGEQVGCNNSSQHKIDHKIKGLNDGNRGTQKEEENITQDGRKTENETQESDFKIHELNRNDENHEQKKEDTQIEKQKNAESQINKENHPNQREEEIEKNEEIITLESQSDYNKKKAEVVGKTDNNKEQKTKEQTEKER